METDKRQFKPWAYSVLLHFGVALLLVLSFRFGSSTLPSLGGRNPETEPVQATVVDQALIDQQMAMLKAEQQKKQQEQQTLEQNISSLKQQQVSAQQQLNQQLTDLQKQAQSEQDKLAKLKAEDTALQKKRETADTAARRKQLQDEIAGEEKQRDARLASLGQRYRALIQQKIISNWVIPPSSTDTMKCQVQVHQVQGGTVVSANVLSCTDSDDTFRQSIVTAVLKSSPLPAPPDPSLFDPDITFDFAPPKH